MSESDSAADDRTFLVVVDVAAFRDGAGRLLSEVQRIKAEGDFAAAQALLEAYAAPAPPLAATVVSQGRPVLLIYGERDERVPVEVSLRNIRAALEQIGRQSGRHHPPHTR